MFKPVSLLVLGLVLVLNSFAKPFHNEPTSVGLLIRSSSLKGKVNVTSTFYQNAFLSAKDIKDEYDVMYLSPIEHVFRSKGQSVNILLSNFKEAQYVHLQFDKPEVEANFGCRNLLLFPGDKITITENKGYITFSGNGSKKAGVFLSLEKTKCSHR